MHSIGIVASAQLSAGTGGGGGGGYVAKAVHFDGATWLNIASLIAGADSPYLSATFFFRSTLNNTDTNSYSTFYQNAGSVSSYSALLTPVPAAFFADMVDATDTNSMANIPSATLYDGNWHSTVIAGQSNLPAGQKILKIYIDRVDQGSAAANDINPSFVMTNNGVQFSIANDTFGDMFVGDLCNLRIDDKSWLAAGDIDPTILDLLVTAGNKPVDPALATAFLGAPLILFDGDKDSYTNQGSGGSFTIETTTTFSIFGGSGAGPIPLAWATVGLTVVSVMDTTTSTDVSSDFETTISVATQIQQTGSSDYSSDQLNVTLSGTLTNATTSPSD